MKSLTTKFSMKSLFEKFSILDQADAITSTSEIWMDIYWELGLDLDNIFLVGIILSIQEKINELS